ncbi:2-dehydropantoate 2-reductase [Halomonas sp. MCCC 1A17488]|uniref:ketopantoate reductase family protein n=1 Tax=unclassified Halomonas TaxID=2609666 RepID=UPI0018D206C9|nr:MULTISPECIES: 2-dehydropantoate 2-reductase [unclassified Halomonas]MCE8015609.1 2-dehydropantoate 2-reductase [Halomonas sp. MCCC 1A17488]MCG3238942.1 2-dehydropantoate 2-reductase [Halomonas sp. MCCC 1A17488]QPP51105.1 2-dehydropantoate 2-reductase [Halomonas sp. SS10-MC5]
MNDQTHLIVGPGALGRLLALSLAEVAPVALAGRRMLPAIQTLTTPDGSRRSRRVATFEVGRLPSATPAFVHLTTKAYDAEAAYAAVMARLAGAPTLVLWQNGYRVQPDLDRRHPGPVLCASTTEGAWLAGDDGVVHAGRGVTYVGDLANRHSRRCLELATLLGQAGLAADAVEDIETRLWHKLAVNAAINPLVARFRIRNGQLRDRPFRPMVERVIDEVARIMAAEGISPPAGGWDALVWRVVAATAGNRASMLQDVLAGRPTEREAILGPLLAAARRHDIAAPCLSELDDSLLVAPSQR